MADVDWPTLVLDQRWMQRLEAAARRRFRNELLAEEAASYVLEQLSANQWQRLRAFRGMARAQTYLNTVSAHLLEEFSRRRFGRPRPPLWLQRAGSLWVKIWQQLCLERQAAAAVIQRWITRERSAAQLQQIITTIKARMPWCGAKHEEIPASYLQRSDSTRDPLERADDNDPEQINQRNQLEMLLLVVRLILEPELSWSMPESGQLRALQRVLAQLHASLAMTPQEQLMLRLVYLEGMKQTLVARALRLEPYQLSRKLAALTRRLRVAISELDAGDEPLPELLACKAR